MLKKKLIRVFFIIFSLFIIENLNGGNGLPVFSDSTNNIPYRIKHFSSIDGLTQVTINALLRDKQGFLWVGTQDGLNRFDGKEFLQFRYDSNDSLGLQGNYILTLLQDSKDRIWIGTMNKGLFYYEPETGIFHRVKTKQENKELTNQSHISSIKEDKYGNIWVNSLDFGVFMFKEKENGFFKIKKILGFDNEEQTTDIYISENQDIYISTNFGKIFVAITTMNGIKKLKVLSTLPVQSGRNCLYANNGFLWVGTDYGLWQINLKNLESIPYNLEINSNIKSGKFMVLTIVPYKNNLWVGTSKGAYLLSGIDKNGKCQTKRLFSENTNYPMVLSSNIVLSILPDSNNLVWIGVNKNLNLLDFNVPVFKTISRKKGKGLNYSHVFAIYKNKTGLWVGTAGGGVNLFSNGKVYYWLNVNIRGGECKN